MIDTSEDSAAVRVFPPVIPMNWWLLLLAPVCGWLLQRLAILPEEDYLERKFGESYLAYKDRVRRWL